MPVKRRTQKRRATPEAEAAAWSTYWECGFDFFGEAADLAGLVEPVNVWPDDRPAAATAWKAASEDAWRRCGHLFEGTRHDAR